jgi:hypothetical protein
MPNQLTEDDIWARLENTKRSQDTIYKSCRFLWQAMTFFNLSDSECYEILKSDLRLGFFTARIAQYGLSFSPHLVRDWQDSFNITQNDVQRILVKNIHVMPLPVSEVYNNLQEIISYFKTSGYPESSFVKAFLQYPTLFGQPPHTIIKHVDTVARHLLNDGISTKAYLGIVLKKPSLFFLDASKTIERIENILSWFEKNKIPRTTGLKRIMNTPSLFYMNSDTLFNNLNQATLLMQEYGIPKEDYANAVSDQPTLFFAKTKRIQNRIETVATHFQNDGLTPSKYASIAVSLPRLLLNKPNTVIHHIESVPNHFAANGMTTKMYLQAATKQKSLFSQNPEVIINHVEQVASVIQMAGVNKNEYIQAALKQPSLFCLDHNNIIRHSEMIIQTGLELDIWQDKKNAWKWLCQRPIPLCFSDNTLRKRKVLGKIQQKRGQTVFKDIFYISNKKLLQKMCILNDIVLDELYKNIDNKQLTKNKTKTLSSQKRDDIDYRYIRRWYAEKERK